MKTYHIIVKGKVQGVGFRSFTKSIALALNITGIVRNLSDASVYIEATGTQQNLQQFIQQCHQGPIWAMVEAVEASEIPLKKYKGFQIVT